jgi:hypothetical protein
MAAKSEFMDTRRCGHYRMELHNLMGLYCVYTAFGGSYD